MEYWVAYYGAKLCGPYHTHGEADTALKGWKAYYHEDCNIITEPDEGVNDMAEVPGAKHAAAKREEERRREELKTELNIWWKRLDSNKPLTGKEKAKLQNTLSAVRMALNN